MRTLILTGALAAIALPASAHAAETYVGVSGGLAMPESSSNEGAFTATVPATSDWGAIPSGTPLAWDTKFETGFAVSGQIGLRFASGLRGEIEISYTSADVEGHENLAAGGAVIDGVDVAVLTRGAPSAANPTVGQVIADGRGKVKTLGAFLNGFYDIGAGGSFSPYLGAGIGYQRVDVLFQPSGVPVADDDDSGFAWQAMAGASVAVARSAALFVQYTYRQSFQRADVPLDLLPATLGVENGGSLVTAGIRFSL